MPRLVPIRLAKRDGSLIHLDAESFTIGVNREVGAMNVLFTQGLRIGTDMNQARLSIIIDVVFVDDDPSALAGDNSNNGTASMFFTFDTMRHLGEWAAYKGDEQFGGYFPEEGKNCREIYNKMRFLFTSHDRKMGKLTGANGFVIVKLSHNAGLSSPSISGTVGEENTPVTGNHAVKTITVSHNLTTFANVAAAFQAAFTTSAPALGIAMVDGGSNQKLSDAFSASIRDGYSTGTSNAGVTVTSVQSGLGLNHTYPHIMPDNKPYIPHHIAFNGGWNPTQIQGSFAFSAAEKVQNILGIVSNSNDKVTKDSRENISEDVEWWGERFGNRFDVMKTNDDYIVGLQIPYESIIASGTNQGRVLRNFFLTNGRTLSTHKGSEGNITLATAPFNPEGDGQGKAGIEVTIDAFDFTYDAGDNLYRGKISCLPVDVIY